MAPCRRSQRSEILAAEGARSIVLHDRKDLHAVLVRQNDQISIRITLQLSVGGQVKPDRGQVGEVIDTRKQVPSISQRCVVEGERDLRRGRREDCGRDTCSTEEKTAAR